MHIWNQAPFVKPRLPLNPGSTHRPLSTRVTRKRWSERRTCATLGASEISLVIRTEKKSIRIGGVVCGKAPLIADLMSCWVGLVDQIPVLQTPYGAIFESNAIARYGECAARVFRRDGYMTGICSVTRIDGQCRTRVPPVCSGNARSVVVGW